MVSELFIFLLRDSASQELSINSQDNVNCYQTFTCNIILKHHPRATWDTVHVVLMATLALIHEFPWLPDFSHKGAVSAPVMVFLRRTLRVPTVKNPQRPLMW